MTQKNIELLLKDLCARLPYGVLCHVNGDDTNTPRKLSRIEVDELDGILLDFWTGREDFLSIQVYLSEVKPYLRPLSSMTKEERSDMSKAIKRDYIEPYGEIKKCGSDNLLSSSVRLSYNLIDWLNAHHFDYRGLIEKGLAIKAPDGMYNFK